MSIGVVFAASTPLTYTVAPSPSTLPIEVIDIEEYTREVAREYGINEYEFVETMRCESRFEIDIQSEHLYTEDRPEWGVLKGERELSFGVAQIHLPSHPGVTREMAIDPTFALPWSAKHFKEGRASMWTCWRTLFN